MMMSLWNAAARPACKKKKKGERTLGRGLGGTTKMVSPLANVADWLQCGPCAWRKKTRKSMRRETALAYQEDPGLRDGANVPFQMPLCLWCEGKKGESRLSPMGREGEKV